MKTFIHPTDIPVIAKIFHPTSDVVFVIVPPNTQYNLANISANLGCTIRFFVNQQLLEFALAARADQAMTVLNLHPDGIDPALVTKYPNLVLIDVFGKKNASTLFGTSQFDFINNTDGTIRWMYNHLHKRPIFLNLYNTSNWKGQLFKTVFKTGFKIGAKNWLKSGAFWITAANELFLNTINHKGQYAIFTGTVGANRKAVVSFEQGQKATRFLKMPLTKSANTLVANELDYLQELQGYKLRKMITPKPKKIGTNLMVSNVRPEHPINNNDLKGRHLAALYELYEHTVTPAKLKELPTWLDIQEDLALLENATIINDLPKEKINRIKQLLNQLAEQLSTNDFVPTSIAHGDLTPWNSYLTDKALHVYDWELAERLPLFYDAFHYIFQTSILVKRLPFRAIERQIEAFAKMSIVERMIGEFELNFKQVYQFYLLRNTAYYVRRYVSQPHLHTQAHWLVDTWLKALESLTYVTPQPSLKKVLFESY